jgi:cysteinyl-tRNA synthetase
MLTFILLEKKPNITYTTLIMIKLYNTLSRQKEELQPLNAPEVTVYQCGPTVYWRQHLGNLRAAVMADLIVRSLSYLGYEPKFVRNYTDVGHLTSDGDIGEDKISKGAQREGLTPEAIADKYIKLFLDDAGILGVLPATVAPQATQHIDQMIAMISDLIDKDYAYTTDLAVYFDVSKAKDYTKLSRQDLDKQITDAGHGEVSDPNKRHPADFVLWFFKVGTHAGALQTWTSPFVSPLVTNGEGFPGWHIECSAMAREYLGDTLDIHIGGIEHIPVHHTNEIAQSESVTGKLLSQFWLHYEHLSVDDRKISKSDGTAINLDDVVTKGFSPRAVRYFLLQAHYRSKQNFSWEALVGAQQALANIEERLAQISIPAGEISQKYQYDFTEALSDDINIPQALAVVWEVLKSELDPADKKATVLDFDRVLGLGLGQVAEVAIPSEVEQFAQQRQQARFAKDWAEADRLRAEIEKYGFTVLDSDNGYRLVVKK